MDRIDRTLLDRLQRDARTPIAALADEAGASPASVQRRLRRLRADGTIGAHVAVIDPRRVGFGLTILVTVELERDGPRHVDAFHRRARAEPQVQQCYCVAGDTDFMLVLLMRDMEDYESFQARFFADPNVRHYKSSVVVTRVKTGQEVPVGPGFASEA